MTLCKISSVLVFIAFLITGDLVRAEMVEHGLPVRPLNLSLPRDDLWPSTVRNQPSAGLTGREASNLPNLGVLAGRPDARSHLPYGSGYEARQRGNAMNSGTAPGAGGFGRGGMGRSR